MINRLITQQIIDRLRHSPAVALLGPRQVGKTTVAKQVATHFPSLYLDMEDPQDRHVLTDAKLFLQTQADKLVIIDEVHLSPGLFPILRGLIDKGRREGKGNGRFLLLGSASLDLLKQSGESLAGRIAYIELQPLQASELPQEDLMKLWSRGGFPESYLAASDADSFRWRIDFVRTYLERDVPEFGFRIPPETLRRFWTMMAHTQMALFNASTLSRSLATTNKTITGYLDLLVHLLLARKLMPWTNNAGKRMIKSPKAFFIDSGLVHALLGIGDWQALMAHPIAGASWEAFVIENIISACPFGTLWSFFRSAGGAELDLILELPNNRGTWAIEVKLGLTPQVSKGFYAACDDIAPTKRFVVYTGKDRYPLSPQLEVISLHEIVSLLQNKE